MRVFRILKSPRFPTILTCAPPFNISHAASRFRNLKLAHPVQKYYTNAAQESRDRHADEEDVRIEDNGLYDMILPEHLSKQPLSTIQRRLVPLHIPRPAYATPDAIRRFHDTDEFHETWEGDGRIVLGSMEERKLRKVAHLAARVLNAVGEQIAKRVLRTTNDIDAAVHDLIIKHNAYPSPLDYKGFPKSCCTSVNNIAVHGIPDNRTLLDGDIVNVDITLYLDGFHGDTSKTFLIGDVDRIGRDLVAITEDALEAGIAACGPGRPFRDIAHAIHRVICGKGYVVSPAFTGHGIGKDFHRPPWIYHDVNEEPEVMKPGHCFTIEPCVIKGSDSDIAIFPDGWTASTESLARSAQAEHMIYITQSGADVLTRL